MSFKLWTKCFRVVTPTEAAAAMGVSDNVDEFEDAISVILYADNFYMTRDADGIITLEIEGKVWRAMEGDLDHLNRMEEELYDWWVAMFHDDDNEQQRHAIARACMDMRPDLSPMSLDDWLIEYGDRLSPEHKALGHEILAEFATA